LPLFPRGTRIGPWGSYMSKPATFSTSIDPALAKKLKADLEDQGFEFTYPLHSLFSAKKRGVSLTLYKSGALVVQGKEKEPFIEFYLEPEILKDFTYTNPLANLDLTPRIGMDEAGKGDYYGPLCVTSLYADSEGINTLVKWGVKDSKTFSDKKILELGKKIQKEFQASSIKLFPLKYNELYEKFNNLNRMLAWAHATALGNLYEKTHCKNAILDKFGPDSLVESALNYKNISINLVQKTKAESDPVVAAASIVARMEFLFGMDSLSKEVGITLPKGANNGIITTGKQLVSAHGPEILRKAGKLHFKTTGQIL